MRSRLDLARHVLDHAYRTLALNVENLSLEEALFVPEGGYRSVLGTLKHAAGWSHVYRSFAFEASPKHWNEIEWPGGCRDTIVKSRDYILDMIAWFDQSHRLWMGALAGEEDAQGLITTAGSLGWA